MSVLPPFRIGLLHPTNAAPLIAAGLLRSRWDRTAFSTVLCSTRTITSLSDFALHNFSAGTSAD
jgi:hypothetical protein